MLSDFKIAGITVLYNSKKKDICHINKYINLVDIMIILDNTENSQREEIFQIIGQKKCIYKPYFRNIGLAAALNDGMNIAFENGCEWSLLMDDDSILKNNILDVYNKFIFKQSGIAVFSPIHMFDRSKKSPYIGSTEKLWSMTSGCLYNNSIFKEIGGFNVELFVDGIDMDYGYRANELGYKVIECGEALVIHNPAQTYSVKLFGNEILKYGKASPWRYYMQARALIWSTLRYRQPNDLLMYFWKWVKILLFFDKKREYISQMIRGTKEGFKLWRVYERDSNK